MSHWRSEKLAAEFTKLNRSHISPIRLDLMSSVIRVKNKVMLVSFKINKKNNEIRKNNKPEENGKSYTA